MSFKHDRLTHHKDQDNVESRKEVQRIIVNEGRKEMKINSLYTWQSTVTPSLKGCHNLQRRRPRSSL